jgi:pimeloyl-ACP methyl ester carboxylesterase
MVVVLPGITGSILQKDDKDLWAFSGEAVYDAVFHRNEYLDTLRIQGPDLPDLDDLSDGVRATGLVRNASLVPGLVKLFDGYNAIGETIRARFDVLGHGAASDEPSNLFEFPYDWRRDNRVAARKLGRLIEERLAQWRKFTFNKHARTILLAHSMGGLVARYYLEVLDGWRNCLALVTFGTPYCGSVNSLNFLANGYKQKVVDLSECLRSFTSVYQLLPTYRVVRVDGEYRRIAECCGLPNLSQSRAAAAAQFHAEIDAKVREHQEDPEYLTNGYKIIPFVGTRQPTLQSAVFDKGKLNADTDLPPEVYETLEGGDGTVPRYSATPLELSGEFRETFVPEKHGSLQASRIVLSDLLGRLEQMQVPKAIRGPEIATESASLTLTLEDMYVRGEPIRIRASVAKASTEYSGVVASVERVSDPGSPRIIELARSGEDWETEIPNLQGGLYKLELRTKLSEPTAPPPVHDVFQVET